MGLKLRSFELTVEMLRLAYRLLAETPPFNKWNLPDSHDIKFIVTRSNGVAGHFREYKRGRAHDSYEIAISARVVGTLATLINIMAHEMVHLYQAISRPRTETAGVEHNTAFRRLADEVVSYHHFDRKMFADID